MRWLTTAIVLAIASPSPATLAQTALAQTAIGPGWDGTRWSESTAELAQQYGPRATRLDRPIDFGDAYVDLVLRNYAIGGYPFVVYFQMDKANHGLKRIQIERGRHGAVPMVYQAAIDALIKAYGPPTESCLFKAHTVADQDTAEHIWRGDGTMIRALFRAQSLNTLDPYIARSQGDFTTGTALEGLSQQLLVRVAPADSEPDDCRDHAKLR
jgi:hypothetical protein